MRSAPLALLLACGRPEPAPMPPAADDSIQLLITDTEGRASSGTLVGPRGTLRSGGHWAFMWQFGKANLVTDSSGRVDIDAQLLFGPEMEVRSEQLFAVNVADERAGFMTVHVADIGRRLTWELEDTVPVNGSAASPELEGIGETLGVVSFSLRAGGIQMIWVRSQSHSFELPVPPGEYELIISSAQTQRVTKSLLVPRGVDAVELPRVELPLARLRSLVGKRAPELSAVRGWLGEPSPLASLRGRVVVLGFWAYWCDPCKPQLHRLADLRTEYTPSDVAVLGVHSDALDTLDALSEAMRELPVVPTALDQGPVFKAYGIQTLPQFVVVDRAGLVVGAWPDVGKGLKAAIDRELQRTQRAGG